MSPSPDRQPVSPFVGDSEMAQRMRAFDWSATVLGPVEGWPVSLRSVVGILLTSRFSMWLGWGPELTFFYNDAYWRDTLRAKHPWALGRPAHEVWAEIWHDIGPRIESVLASGVATWDASLLLFLERSGYPEETYHTFSYSPLTDEDGRVVGMLCVVSEDTDRVLSERRMATLRDLASAVAATQTRDDVLAAVREQVGDNVRDMPFSLTYLFDDHGIAHLACTTGIEAGATAAPGTVEGGAEETSWPISRIREGHSVLVDDLRSRFGLLPAGAWTQPPTQAAVVPLAAAQGQGPVAGFLVVGLNPHRRYDDRYRGFIELVASQVAAGLITAGAYEAESRRAEALAELDRAKTEFFSNISHEFRTPLTLITGPLEELRATPAYQADPRLRAELEVIHRNGLRLGKLVNTLLDFSGLQSGRIQARYEPLELGVFTAELASLFRSAIERAGLEFIVDCADLGEPVHVDREMWEKVVLNLLSNAVKFTFSGHITVALRRSGKSAVLTVADTGTGIPAQELPRLFERFHRIRGARARSHEGSGIGLAMVAQLVGLHGGAITADSSLGQGTTFTVTLPLGSVHLPAEQLTAEAAGSAAAEGSDPFLAEALRWLPAEQTPSADDGRALAQPRGRRVLVADDNADMREYLGRLLGVHYDVQTVPDGSAALDAARAQPPDVIISDVMMPNLDGLKLVTALREDPRTASVPVLLLSARAGHEAVIEGFDIGADDYVVKPFSAGELLARVRSTLAWARRRAQESAWRSTLISALQDGLFITDPDGTVVEVNDAFHDIVGYGAEGLPYAVPYPWWPDSEREPEEYQQVQDAFHAALNVEGDGRWVLPARHRLDGRRVWLSVSLGKVIAAEGTVTALVGTVRDVTAEHVRASRDAALARLSGRLAQASDVASVTSAGLAELATTWPTYRAMILTWDDAEGVVTLGSDTSWAELSPTTRAAITQVRVTGRVHHQPGDASVDPPRPTLVGAPVPFGAPASVVWLELDPARPFTAEDTALLTALAAPLGQALTRARLFDEQRSTSLTLQRAILGPIALPPGFAVRYEPALRRLAVGGDWYDIVELDADRVGVAVGDCVGHGLAAAAVMGQLRTACRTLLLQAHAPASVLSAMDKVAALIPNAVCTTLLCATIDRATGTLNYSSAAHPPAILARAKGRTELLTDARGVPLATIDVARPHATVLLAPGDTVLLYTDGLVERRRCSLDAGISLAREALTRNRHLTPVEIAERLAQQLLADGHDDDVAYLVYQHSLPVGHSVTTTVAARPEQLAPLRRTLRQWLSATGVEQHTIDDVVLAAGEAASNAAEHAYLDADPGSIELTLSHHTQELHVQVRDYGRWRTNPVSGSRGRGVRMIEHLTDAHAIDTDETGTTVQFHKKLP